MSGLDGQTLTKLGKARLLTVEQYPYLSAAVYSLIPIKAEGLTTLGVDKYWRLYVDPEAVKRWEVRELAAVLAHEVGHLLRDHDGRRPSVLHPRMWNVAGDAEINDDLRTDALLPLPESCVFPEKIGAEPNLTVEQYALHLLENAEEGGEGIPALSDEGQGDGEDKQQGPGPMHGDCGSAAGGQPKDYELGAPDDKSGGLDKSEADLVRREVAQDVASRGDVAGGWARWAEATLKPRVPWRKVLAGQVRSAVKWAAGSTDYTYRRRSRRRIPGVILPGLFQPKPDVAIVIDTSGSMGDKTLQQAVAEVEGIVRACGAEVRLVSVDAEVHGGVQNIRRASQVKLAGGGGTDMGVGLEAVVKKERPDVVVVLTDGLTPWPGRSPKGVKVIVVLAGPYKASPDTVPGWARVVTVDDE